jgi:hypothetical protein
MSNFITEFKKGQEGGNKGLSMGEGLTEVSRAINGVQKAMMIGIAASPKVGKSTLVDYAFIIQPYLQSLKDGNLVDWTYFSFEMDRVSKEFDFAIYFIYHDFGYETIKLPEGVTVGGKTFICISSAYLRGRLQDDNDKIVKIDNLILTALKNVYEKRIIPLFGEYSDKGILLKEGLIDFIEQKENPTGLRNKMLDKAKDRGQLIYQEYTDKLGNKGKKLVGYVANNPNITHIVVTDTIRKIPRERGFSLKETIDKYLEYTTEIRNLIKFTFIHIVHLNRNMGDVHRMKMLGDMLYPVPEDIKDFKNKRSSYIK